MAIRSIGGVRVTELLGASPEHENADFVFRDEGVIVELKCLDEDKIRDQTIIAKASKLYLDELKAGRAPAVVFGTVRTTTDGFSPKFTKKIGDLYRVPVERRIRKADRQVEATAKALGMTEAQGVVLIANNNHSALDPTHMAHILFEALAGDCYPNINVAVGISGNLAARSSCSDERIEYWIEVRRNGLPAIDGVFLDSVRAAWCSHLSQRFGRVLCDSVNRDLSYFKSLSSG